MAFAEVRARRVAASSVAANAGRSSAFVPVDAGVARGAEIVALIAGAAEAALQIVAASLVADSRFEALVHIGATPTVAVQLVT